MKSILLALVAAMAFCVSSCMVGPNFKPPKAPLAQQWTTTAPAAATQPSGQADAYWWATLKDPILDRLIDKAHQDNLSLQSAAVRVLQARAQLNVAVGELFPQQQVFTGQYLASHTPNSLATPGLSQNVVSGQTLLSATWEIDVWGKFRRNIQADEAAWLGTLATYDDALVTLTADVAATYVNIRTAQERLKVAQTNADTQRESLRIVTAQFKAGASGERDVQQASAQLAQTEAQIPQVEQTIRQSKNALAVLLGITPDRVDWHLAAGGIPQAPPAIAMGIPRDLLRRRPDVRAAGLAAASQSALIGVAEAQRYPAFSLLGDFGFASNNQGNHSVGDIFQWNNRVLDGGVGVAFPILNYGRLINQVRVQDAAFQQALLNYENTVLVAQQEVEDGMATFTSQQKVAARLTDAVKAARRSTELALVQYKAGQTDYTTVISAQQAQLSVEDALATAQGNVVQGLIAVYRALGGGWEVREGRDIVPAAVKEEMARRTDWGRMLNTARHLPSEAMSAPASLSTQPSP